MGPGAAARRCATRSGGYKAGGASVRLARACAAALLLGALLVPRAAGAQAPDTVGVVAGPQYDAGALRRLLYGENWRRVWLEPVEVPVLDLRSFAGGLTPQRRGGGQQTLTLHMEDAAGDRWIFRSIDKRPGGGTLPWEVAGAPAAAMITDHVSALHPGGHFAVPPVLEAAGILHTPPRLFVMPDDPALGEFRVEYAGMLGAIELRPNQGPDGTPGFAGSRRILSTQNLFDVLDSGQYHRVAEAELLRARLVDMLLGDTDRGTDQWRWARFEDGDGYVWRPIPEDRDWVFAHADGLFARVAQGTYAKLARYDERLPPVTRFTFSSHIVDRRLLTRLGRHDFAREAEFVRRTVTDDVIERAIAALPAPWAAVSGERLRSALRARRDALPELALDFYRWLADAVDVRGTRHSDVALVERGRDGTVRVRLYAAGAAFVALDDGRPDGQPAPGALPAPPPFPSPPDEGDGEPAPYYDRTFLPHDTREVRIHLLGGDNVARVTGARAGPITVRIIGGDGADLLEDLAGGARFYKHMGEARVVRAAGTRVNTRPWTPPPAPEGLRGGYAWAPDWGSDLDFGVATDYDERSGALVGGGATWTRYGFRRIPHETEARLRLLWAPRTGALRADLDVDRRLENSRRALVLHARATRADEFPLVQAGRVVFDYDAVRLEPGLLWYLGPRPGLDPAANLRGRNPLPDDLADGAVERSLPTHAMRVDGTFRLGPALRWSRLELAGEAERATRLGARAELRLRRHEDRPAPRRGFRVDAEAGTWPWVRSSGTPGRPALRPESPVPGAFSEVGAVAAAYVPLLGDGPHLALRGGGERLSGDFPLVQAAFLGGRHSLRGTRTHERVGDTRLFGSVELRVPVDTVRLYVNAELGVFSFADAGRVWLDGASDGWQAGFGGGVWLAAFGRAISIAAARGPHTTRWHAWFGLPF